MVPKMKRLVATTAVALLAAGAPAGAADPAALRLDLRDPGWELAGADTVVEEFDGEVALRLKSGSATWRDIEFLDGTIEFDLQVTPYRSFSYIYFRMETDQEHEEFYFRSHKSLLPDAVQYAPVYKGSSQWQLYHDARSTAAAPLPAGEWIPVKVVVEGARAAVFVGSVETPQLVVPELAREPRPGPIALRSFMTFGTPADTYVSNFANVVVRPGVVHYEFPEAEAAAPPAGLITSWQVSPAFSPPNDLLTVLPEEVLTGDGWQTVTANAEGLVEIERPVSRPEGVRRAAVLAALRVTAAEATTRRLYLGFSDEVSVFLNGRLLVADDESFIFNLPRRQGLLTGEELSVFLPLEAGANELVLAIADRFGGWGVSGRFEDAAGLEVEPRPAGAEPADDSTEAAGARGEIARLAWLAGCWHGEAGEECWLAPRGGMMLGVNRGPDRQDRSPFFELLRVVEEAGGLILLAQPAGRSPATPFRAVEIGDSRVVFANPEHDFPQRITYWREGAALKVRVEAQRDGEWQGFEQAWSPAPWPGDDQAVRPGVLEDTHEAAVPESAPDAGTALAAALERASMEGWRELDLVVECQRDGRLETLQIWGSGVGVWQGSRQFRLPREEIGAILDELLRDGFAAMSPVYGGPPDSIQLSAEGSQGTRIVCRMVLELDGHVKQVAQRMRGEQSAELKRLAGGILDRCRDRGLGGVAAESLADGLAKLTTGTLAPETLRIIVQRKPEGTAASADDRGWLLRIHGYEATARATARSAGYGEPMVVRLGEKELQSIVTRLAANGVHDLPINLWAEQYTDLLIEILGHRKSIQARRFAGLEPDTHGAAQERFDAVLGALRELSARMLAPARGRAG